MYWSKNKAALEFKSQISSCDSNNWTTVECYAKKYCFSLSNVALIRRKCTQTLHTYPNMGFRCS